MGEAMKQMADVKYSLDDNIKQNFLEPLHHLQTKDLKEVMVRLLEKLCIVALGQARPLLHALHAFDLLRFVDFSTIGRNCKAVGWTSTASGDARRKVRSGSPHVALASLRSPLAFPRSYWFIQARAGRLVSARVLARASRRSRCQSIATAMNWSKNRDGVITRSNDRRWAIAPSTRVEEP